MKKIKFITSIYSNLYGTEFGGRASRYHHYRFSLLSLLKMYNADFVCYTSDEEYDSLCDFFYVENKIQKEKLNIVKFDLTKHYFADLFEKYKNVDEVKKGDRCYEIQYMKFIWYLKEDMSYDYYFWIDAGLSHCGLIPNKYLATSLNGMQKYYESSIFTNTFLKNLADNTEDKFTIIKKENSKHYWSGTVNISHYNNYERSYHVIGGIFGGEKKVWNNVVDLFKKYAYQVTCNDSKIYSEENIMTLMYFNHKELFKTYDFDIWWHEDEKMSDIDMIDYTSKNKSFYKILEEINGLNE
jgi:hypothetical protein